MKVNHHCFDHTRFKYNWYFIFELGKDFYEYENRLIDGKV